MQFRTFHATVGVSMSRENDVYINYIITRVHSSFSLVENRDLLEDRRTADVISVTNQSQPISQFINSQLHALFCINRDHVK